MCLVWNSRAQKNKERKTRSFPATAKVRANIFGIWPASSVFPHNKNYFSLCLAPRLLDFNQASGHKLSPPSPTHFPSPSDSLSPGASRGLCWPCFPGWCAWLRPTCSRAAPSSSAAPTAPASRRWPSAPRAESNARAEGARTLGLGAQPSRRKGRGRGMIPTPLRGRGIIC